MEDAARLSSAPSASNAPATLATAEPLGDIKHVRMVVRFAHDSIAAAYTSMRSVYKRLAHA